jgi:uncharacterized OsmC-like protein
MNLNGMNVEALKNILEEVKLSKEKVKALTVWRTRIRWLGGFKARAYMRRHSLDIDEVSDLAGVDTAQNPVETLLAALGACIMITFVYNATLRNIEIENLEIALEGQIENILVFLGLEKEGNPGFNNIKIDIYVKSNAEKEIIEEIVKESINASPVAATLTRNVNLIHKVKIF